MTLPTGSHRSPTRCRNCNDLIGAKSDGLVLTDTPGSSVSSCIGCMLAASAIVFARVRSTNTGAVEPFQLASHISLASIPFRLLTHRGQNRGGLGALVVPKYAAFNESLQLSRADAELGKHFEIVLALKCWRTDWR